MKIYSKISDIQYYLPPKLLSNEDLVLDNPDWKMDDIEKKTGVKYRYICEDNQTSKDIAVLACEKLFKNSVKRSEIDFLIVVTESPEYIAPPMSCDLQNSLNLDTSVVSFDINLGCSGFVYGLMVADSILRANNYKKGILVCVDTYSKYISRHDRTCRPLFSDAASAALITSSKERTVGPFILGTDGSGYQDLIVKNSGNSFELVEKNELIASLREQIKLLNGQVTQLTKERDQLKIMLDTAKNDIMEQERRSQTLKEMANKYEKDLEVRERSGVVEGKQ